MDLWSLWLPMLLAGLGVHVMSFLCWVVFPHHKGDWRKMPNEDRFLDLLRQSGIGQGNYSFPGMATPEEYKSPEFQARYQAGPRGLLAVWDDQVPNMGANMAKTVVFFVFASFCLGYLSTLALKPGDDFLTVFRFFGTAGLLTFSFAGIPNAIWFRWKIAGHLADGVLYSLTLAVIYAALWPQA